MSAPPHAASESRLFWLWLSVRSLVWVVAVGLSHPNAPLDLVEWLSWGHVWQWGYPKHPPLPAWLADAAARLHPGHVWPVYLLSYTVTALTLLAAWQLAREFLPPRNALLAVGCLDGLMYLTNDPAEYSNNVVLNAGWAWLTLAVFRAVRSNSPRWWLAVGVILGLSLLTKYTVGVLVLCLAGWTLWDRAARRVWLTPGPYLAAAVAVVVVAPHLHWLWQNQFLPFRYAAARSTEEMPEWRRVIFPVQFVAGQLLYLLPVLTVLGPALSFVLRRHGGERMDPLPSVSPQNKGRFLDFVVLGPVVVLVGVSAAAGTLLREIWGSPLWTFVGVWLVVRFGRPEGEINWRAVGGRWAVVATLLVAFTVAKQLAGPYLTGKAERPHFPGPQLAAEVNRRWAERYGGLPPIIGGEAWRAGNIAVYSPHRPVVYTTGVMGHLVMDPEYSPWTSDAEVNASGAAIVWDADVISDERLAAIRARFPRFEVQPVIELPPQTGAKVPPARIGLGFVPPAANP